MRETWVRSLGREDSLEKEMATHSGILAWRIPWTEEPGGLQSMGSLRVGHDWVTSLALSNILCQSPFSSHTSFIPTWQYGSPHKDPCYFFSPCRIVISYVHMFLPIKDIRPLVSLHAGTLCLWWGGHGWVGMRECFIITYLLFPDCPLQYKVQHFWECSSFPFSVIYCAGSAAWADKSPLRKAGSNPICSPCSVAIYMTSSLSLGKYPDILAQLFWQQQFLPYGVHMSPEKISFLSFLPLAGT